MLAKGVLGSHWLLLLLHVYITITIMTFGYIGWHPMMLLFEAGNDQIHIKYHLNFISTTGQMRFPEFHNVARMTNAHVRMEYVN